MQYHRIEVAWQSIATSCLGSDYRVLATLQRDKASAINAMILFRQHLLNACFAYTLVADDYSGLG